MVSLNGFYKKNNDKNGLGVEIKKVKISDRQTDRQIFYSLRSFT